MAIARSMPPATSASSMLSRLLESEPSMETSGVRSLSSGSASVRSSGPRATAQLRLPLIVLISPLWASSRKGWASRHCGHVLVENR